jgi:hypothetical protein
MMDAGEAARREKQRKAQAAAKLQQAAGAPTKKERKKRKRDKASGAPGAADPPKKKGASGGAAWRAAEFRGKGRNDHAKERKRREDLAKEAEGRAVHDVVVVPIFWRNRPGEEDAVVAEAERVKRLLCKDGGVKKLDVWVDRTHKKSPGQKLAFWEAVGVQFRIELGPDDARQKVCAVSRAGADGYASKITVGGVSSVRRADLYAALRDKLGLEKIPDDVAADAALDAAHDAEADATLKAWAKLSDAPRLAATRPKAPKLKIDAAGAASGGAKKIVFGDDALDDSQFALGDAAASSDDDGDDDS